MDAKTPAGLQVPCFLMNFPFTVDNREPNNVLMTPFQGQKYDYQAAYSQFMDLFHEITKHALVYLLPSEGNYQDQTFVANLGCQLPHIVDDAIIVLANFRSKPRIGEDRVGQKFFDSMKYRVIQAPYCWEGEAELKHLRDNLYLAGHGIRTDPLVYNWMEEQFGMEIVRVEMMDPKLYHFDCLCLPMNSHKVMLAVDAVSSADLKAIEGMAEVVEVPKQFIYDGWTNSVRIGQKIFHAPARTPGSQAAFENLCVTHGYEPVIVYLWEYEKSGADLSCMMMHLNYFK
jgi:N-dimethylarginine dimethylaminohydrolase